jgi:hypothetical protein
MSDDLQPDVCSAAPYLLSLSEAHSPPEYGGRVKIRADLSGPYVDVQLLGQRDSPNITAPNADLEDTGTYSVCHASFGSERPASDCQNWVPEPSDYAWQRSKL